MINAPGTPQEKPIRTVKDKDKSYLLEIWESVAALQHRKTGTKRSAAEIYILRKKSNLYIFRKKESLIQ